MRQHRIAQETIAGAGGRLRFTNHSTYYLSPRDSLPEWRNWYTHQTQNLAFARTCRFESDLRHHLLDSLQTRSLHLRWFSHLDKHNKITPNPPQPLPRRSSKGNMKKCFQSNCITLCALSSASANCGKLRHRHSNTTHTHYACVGDGHKHGRSFWQKHRDKLTTAGGAGAGALLGGIMRQKGQQSER